VWPCCRVSCDIKDFVQTPVTTSISSLPINGEATLQGDGDRIGTTGVATRSRNWTA
jgi:hypothetical protein